MTTLLGIGGERRLCISPRLCSKQVKRMLADSTSQALVDNFAGQWLSVRNVQTHQPSPETLFHFDDNLRQALEEEMQVVLRKHHPGEPRDGTDLLDADYTFLNERLAKHYGIPRRRRRTIPPRELPGGQRPRADCSEKARS